MQNQNITDSFKGKTLVLTGGTGSFSNSVLKHFITSDLAEPFFTYVHIASWICFQKSENYIRENRPRYKAWRAVRLAKTIVQWHGSEMCDRIST